MTGEIPIRIAPLAIAKLNGVIRRLESGEQTEQMRRLTDIDLEWVTHEFTHPCTPISRAEAIECWHLARRVRRMLEQ